VWLLVQEEGSHSELLLDWADTEKYQYGPHYPVTWLKLVLFNMISLLPTREGLLPYSNELSLAPLFRRKGHKHCKDSMSQGHLRNSQCLAFISNVIKLILEVSGAGAMYFGLWPDCISNNVRAVCLVGLFGLESGFL